jgi:GT2 family glycosyltransferase
MSPKKVTVSIVAYNSENVLVNCIHSIIETTRDMDVDIIVVDNCSGDGSADVVQSTFPDVQLIRNRENIGFGRAHNQSFRSSRGEYFLILNPDTVIFPDAIQKMVAFMDARSDAGVTGCKIYWDDERNFMFPDLRIHSLETALVHFSPLCRYFPNSMIAQRYWKTAHALWKTTTPIRVAGITGGLMMIRRAVFESLGGFDEQFFLFFEEHDLLRRVEKQGWALYYLPDAEIQHYYEESFRNSTLDIGAIYERSALYYYRKHYGIPGYLYIKSLLMLNRLVFSVESGGRFSKRKYPEIYPVNGRLAIAWPAQKGAGRYLAEVSYSPAFFDRAGMYVSAERLSLKSDILDRLPNKTGFLRILPVYDDSSTGKVIRVFKITDQPGLQS